MNDARLSRSLLYHVGVSYPRSGHHLLVRVLEEYFSSDFKYCEYYKPDDCCRNVPCSRPSSISLSKNHDYKDSVPLIGNQRYLIQYRSFLPALISNYELKCRNSGEDSEALFWRFANKQRHRYARFMERWGAPPPPGSRFVRVSYERLTGNALEAFAPIIHEFCPDREVDRQRLAAILGSADRLSVEQGKPTVEVNAGVAAFRDIRAFRYFDEGRFEALDFATSGAFEAMESLPLVVSSEPASAVTPDMQETAIVVDVTGQLQLEGGVHTGVPRVQDFIVRSALADADPGVSCVRFEKYSDSFVPINLAHYRKMVGSAQRFQRAVSLRAIWQAAVEYASVNPFLGKEFDRVTAQRMATAPHQSQGLERFAMELAGSAIRFEMRKYWIRIHRYRNAFRARFSARTLGLPQSRSKGSIMIASHLVLASAMAKAYLKAGRLAFVFHDNIALKYPQFLSTQHAHERKSAMLRQLRETGALALCASDFSLRALQDFETEIGVPTAPRARFPMPSTLYIRAQERGFADRLNIEGPYVLYCSTIEVRKNHLLLAKIWKRALDEGRPLPTLVNVGKWGWGTDALKDYLKANPQLEDHVRFLGPVPDEQLVALYRGARFGVFPSYVEGWGLGASESLDFGLPIIVSTADALAEATGGLMPTVDPDDEEGWYRAIRSWADSDDVLAEYRSKIANLHRPVSEGESWLAIKKAIRAAEKSSDMA